MRGTSVGSEPTVGSSGDGEVGAKVAADAGRAAGARSDELEISVVMPCLNEAETLATCIRKAQGALAELGVEGEVVVADNGSSDGSPEIAAELGARVVPVAERGYGNALRGGIAAARGRSVIMGDADDSYDFSAIAPFIKRLRAGDELVMGNRFRGGIEPAAMPWKHRWIGNPVLTGIGRLFFRCPVGDFHCGLRAVRKSAYKRMELQTTGMEFASEMVIKATLLGIRTSEVPILLHPDGRSRPPHLRSWRDGWRHLRFMLLFSPLWLFLVPGGVLLVAGLLVVGLLAAGPARIGGVEFGVHTMVLAGFACLVGYQLTAFGVFTKAYAISERLHPPVEALLRLRRYLSLEAGVVAGCAAGVAGAALLLAAIGQWRAAGFGPLDPARSMRWMIPAVVLMTLGVQTVFSSFFLSVLTLGRSPAKNDGVELTRGSLRV